MVYIIGLNSQGCWTGCPKHHDGIVQSSSAQDTWSKCGCSFYSEGSLTL